MTTSTTENEETAKTTAVATEKPEPPKNSTPSGVTAPRFRPDRSP